MNPILLNKNLLLGLSIEAAACLLYFAIARYFYYGGGWPFLQIFFGAVYALGGYFVFKSTAPLSLKWLFVFWWVIVLAGMAVVALATYRLEAWQTKKETLLIPAGYRGKITVYYGIPGGEAPVFEDERLVLRIPANGELRTRYQRKWNQVYANHADPLCYFVDEHGKSTPLKYQSDTSLQQDEVFVHYGSVETLDKKTVLKEEFFVFTQGEWEEHLNAPKN